MSLGSGFLESSLPPIKKSEERRAGITCAEFSIRDEWPEGDLENVLMMLGLKETPL